jgi:glutathione S-transferase
VLGLIWIAGRAMHFTGYNKAVKKRLPGFFVQSTACLLLFIGALAGNGATSVLNSKRALPGLLG